MKFYNSPLFYNSQDDESPEEKISCRGLPNKIPSGRLRSETLTMPRMQDIKNLAWFIWDFLLVYIIGTMYLPKELFGKHRKPSGISNREGEVAIVTGGSRGIGMEVVHQLMKEGMHVIIASSSVVSDIELKKLHDKFPLAKVEHQKLDLASLASVKQFVDEFLKKNIPLNILVNNAGIMFGPYKETVDGFESQLGINFLGHFLLTYLLLPELVKSGTPTRKSRIVNVSSCCHFAGRIKIHDLHSKEYYSAHGSYAQTKLAQVMSTIVLQEILDQKRLNVTVNAVHPGIVNTKLYQYTWFDLAPIIAQLFFKTPEQGADGVVHVALSDELESIGGKYYENCQEKMPNTKALDREMQINLWEKTCCMLGVKDLVIES